jgi:hypothetical protein
MNIWLPKWLAKLIFPELEAELARRSKLTGTASKSFEFERGPFRLTGVAQVENEARKLAKAKPAPAEKPKVPKDK